LWINPGIIPILHCPGAIIPGQLGPTRRVFPWVFKISVIRTMSKNVSRCKGNKEKLTDHVVEYLQ
jgi:hypothetical protein